MEVTKFGVHFGDAAVRLLSATQSRKPVYAYSNRTMLFTDSDSYNSKFWFASAQL